MNTTKCRDCKNYDAVTGGKAKVPSHGWCAVKSLYPFKEGPGQLFPAGVRRVASSELPAKPVIVTGEGIVTNCTQVVPKEKK